MLARKEAHCSVSNNPADNCFCYSDSCLTEIIADTTEKNKNLEFCLFDLFSFPV